MKETSPISETATMSANAVNAKTSCPSIQAAEPYIIVHYWKCCDEYHETLTLDAAAEELKKHEAEKHKGKQIGIIGKWWKPKKFWSKRMQTTAILVSVLLGIIIGCIIVF